MRKQEILEKLKAERELSREIVSTLRMSTASNSRQMLGRSMKSSGSMSMSRQGSQYSQSPGVDRYGPVSKL